MQSGQQGQAYTILRHTLGRYRNQLFGSEFRGWVTASPQQAIALLQHLGWPTPYIDLTDDPEVAIFFATDRYEAALGPAEIMVVDRRSLPDDWTLVSHEEVIDPDLNMRWTRQRGFGLLPPGWPGLMPIEEVDLRRLPAVRSIFFQPNADLLSQSAARHAHYYHEDQLALDQLRFIVRGIAELCGFDRLAPDLSKFPH